VGRWQLRLDRTFELFDQIRRSRTNSEMCRHLISSLGKFGVTNVLAGLIPPPQASRRRQLSHVLLDAWPEEWSHRYFSNGYLYRDPTIKLVCRGNVSFSWGEVEGLCRVCPFGRRVMYEAAEFDLCQGLTFAFRTLDGQAAGFSLAGKFLDLDPSEQPSLQLIAALAFGCAVGLTEDARKGDAVDLSQRQRDVLHWASEGLKVEAIADRLGISSHTADTHLRLVREKLGATNSIHAVAQAFRLGLIT
jgi:LuxR family transcriptional regulator, quorum-sensing system regulator BjaR1